MLICFGLGAFASSFSRFDLNEDGAVSITDVTCLLNYLRNPSTDPEEPDDSGDVDTSSDIAPEDVVTVELSSCRNYERNFRGWINSDWTFDSQKGYELYFKITDPAQIIRNVFQTEYGDNTLMYNFYVDLKDVHDIYVTVDDNVTTSLAKCECVFEGIDYFSTIVCKIGYLLGQLPEKGMHTVQINFICDVHASWMDSQSNEFNETKTNINFSGKFTAAMEKLWDDSIGISSIVECNDTSIPVYGNCFRVDVMFDDYAENINDLCFYDVEYYDDLRERAWVSSISPIYCESVSNREAIFYFDKFSKSSLINRNEMYIGSDSGVFLYELLKHEW